MCIAHESRCKCGRETVSFHFKDNILPEQTVKNLYCPRCSPDVRVDHDVMVVDNGWVIEYDMDIVGFSGQKLGSGPITPAFVFDSGYCTWNGIYPGDHRDSVKERERITALAKADPALYLREMKTWATERLERLRREGWRKADEGESLEGEREKPLQC
ncbi:MAG TPA: hypothetical protein VEI96_06260 [Thermodesulfovibrionales bacterium]|nr:hypothetical protein [Thermodesulfovibrionales bacterium]